MSVVAYEKTLPTILILFVAILLLLRGFFYYFGIGVFSGRCSALRWLVFVLRYCNCKNSWGCSFFGK